MSKFGIPRALLAEITGGNSFAIKQLESALNGFGTMPATIEEAFALAAQALALAQANAALLAMLLDAEDFTPRTHLGTVSAQDADQVEITGGAVDGTSIGATAAAAGRFTTLAASGQITSTVADGTAPFVVTSKTVVPNLHAAQADSLGTATAYPANATDLASVIALANALKAANTAKGV